MCRIYDRLDAQHMPKYQRKPTHQRLTVPLSNMSLLGIMAEMDTNYMIATPIR